MKKKLHTCVGELEVSNRHPLSQPKGSFKISRKLQALICLMGQSQVFEDGGELFSKMRGLEVGKTQIQLVSERYGEHIEEEHTTLKQENRHRW
jgi:hypothetical protein